MKPNMSLISFVVGLACNDHYTPTERAEHVPQFL